MDELLSAEELDAIKEVRTCGREDCAAADTGFAVVFTPLRSAHAGCVSVWFCRLHLCFVCVCVFLCVWIFWGFGVLIVSPPTHCTEAHLFANNTSHPHTQTHTYVFTRAHSAHLFFFPLFRCLRVVGVVVVCRCPCCCCSNSLPTHSTGVLFPAAPPASVSLSFVSVDVFFLRSVSSTSPTASTKKKAAATMSCGWTPAGWWSSMGCPWRRSTCCPS